MEVIVFIILQIFFAARTVLKTGEYLRPQDCKYRELIFKTKIKDFFMFCQEKPFGVNYFRK